MVENIAQPLALRYWEEPSSPSADFQGHVSPCAIRVEAEGTLHGYNLANPLNISPCPSPLLGRRAVGEGGEGPRDNISGRGCKVLAVGKPPFGFLVLLNLLKQS